MWGYFLKFIYFNQNHTAVNWQQKQTWESTCLLPSQTSKTFAKIVKHHSSSPNHVILENIIICHINKLVLWQQVMDLLFQSLNHVQLFVTLCNAACQAALSFIISQSLLKCMSIESVMPFNHLILCCPLPFTSIFPSIRVFSTSQLFASGDLSTGASALASVLPMNI